MKVVFCAVCAVLAAGGTSIAAETQRLPAEKDGEIAAALDRFRQWKGEDETVVFPVTTDLHAWYPDLADSPGPGGDPKMHIPYALRVGDRFGADFHLDLGDIGSDRVATRSNGLQGAKFAETRSATREERRRREVSQFALYDKTDRPVFCCVGNHDLIYAERAGDENDWTSVNPAEFGNRFSPLAHGADAVWGEGKHYGYWDVPGKRFRLIFLDNFEFATRCGFSAEQVRFLIRALAVPEDFTVLVAMHRSLVPSSCCWLRNGTMRCRNSYNGKAARFGVKQVVRILEDFVAHEKGSSGGFAWDFTAHKGSRLAGVLTGDSHYDNWTVQNDVLWLCRQGYGSISREHELPHENGAKHVSVSLKDTMLVDVVAVKPRTGELRIFRVGADGAEGDFADVRQGM